MHELGSNKSYALIHAFPPPACTLPPPTDHLPYIEHSLYLHHYYITHLTFLPSDNQLMSFFLPRTHSSSSSTTLGHGIRDKDIKTLIDLGLTREVAIQHLQVRRASQGVDWISRWNMREEEWWRKIGWEEGLMKRRSHRMGRTDPDDI